MDEYVFDGHKLRLFRTRKAMTQRGLAAAAGVNYVTVCRLETGARRRAQAATIQALAGALGVNASSLMTRSRKPVAPPPAEDTP